MKQIFKRAIESIRFGDEVNLIVYQHFKVSYEEVGHTPKNSAEIKFEEFIKFCQRGGLSRKPYFSFTNKEMKEIDKMKEVTDLKVFKADFDWAKKNANEKDFYSRKDEIEKAGVKDDMFGGDDTKIQLARSIMNNSTIKWKSDKIKALLREEFTSSETFELMSKREDMICTMSYIETIHKGLLDGTIK